MDRICISPIDVYPKQETNTGKEQKEQKELSSGKVTPLNMSHHSSISEVPFFPLKNLGMIRSEFIGNSNQYPLPDNKHFVKQPAKARPKSTIRVPYRGGKGRGYQEISEVSFVRHNESQNNVQAISLAYPKGKNKSSAGFYAGLKIEGQKDGSLLDITPRPVDYQGFEGASFISQPSILSKLNVKRRLSDENASRDISFFSLDSLPSSITLGDQLTTLLKSLHVEGIKLPGCPMEMSDVVIKRSVKLRGCAGTQLIIRQGSIDIRPQEHPIVVNIQECTIILKISSDTTIPPRSLINVSSGVRLELQDCQLKAEYCPGHPNYIPASEQKSGGNLPDDICIHVLPDSAEYESKEATVPKLKAKSLAGSLQLNACSFLNFYTHIFGEKNSSISIEKCGFFRSKTSALVAINPQQLVIESSIFEDCSECGIEVRWGFYSQPANPTHIKIESNTIIDTKSSGICISGEKQAGLSAAFNVSLIHNQIQKCRLDGITVRHLQCASIDATQNTCFGNGGAGMNITEVHCPAVNLVNNTMKENGACGLLIQDSDCNISYCEFIGNMGSGIGIASVSGVIKGEESKEINISECSSALNRQSGISLIDFSIGTVNIRNSKFDENKDYGVFMSCADNPSLTQTQSLSASSAALMRNGPSSKVMLLEGQVKGNKKGGIYLNKQQAHIDSTAIRENGEYAVYIPTKDGEKNLSFSACTLRKKTISGLIGGRWGKISIYSSYAVCGCGICTIF